MSDTPAPFTAVEQILSEMIGIDLTVLSLERRLAVLQMRLTVLRLAMDARRAAITGEVSA